MKHLSLDSFDFCGSSSSEGSRHRVSLVEDLDFSRGSGKSDRGNFCVHVFGGLIILSREGRVSFDSY